MRKEYIDDLLEDTRQIVILGHINPDGDCIGSVFGLAAYLDAVFHGSKDIFPLVTDNYNRILERFIPEHMKNATAESVDRACTNSDYACIVVDCAYESRIAYSAYWDNAKVKIAIDHHPGKYKDDCVCFKRVNASSSTCVLFDMMKEEYITPEAATLLYMGLCHDTGLFKNLNVNADTYRIAGELLQRGAKHDDVVKTYNLRTLEELKEEGFYYQMVTTICDGKVAFLCSEVTRKQEEIIRRINPTVRDTEGVEVSFTLLRVTDDPEPFSWRLSMRSKSIPINHICKKFNGGGHPLASGALIKGDSEHILNVVTKELEKLLYQAEQENKTHMKHWLVRAGGGAKEPVKKYFAEQDYDEALMYGLCLKEDYLRVEVLEHHPESCKYELLCVL